MSDTKARNISYDIMRITAILMVLYNHREAFTYFTQVPYMSLKYILMISASVLSRCGPPLFFMISGALLLGKTESFSKIFRHRILRIFIVMIPLALLAYFTWGESVKADGFVSVYTTKLNWYLYAYIAYLFMLPFLRILAQNMNENQKKLFLILTIMTYTLSGICIPLSISEHFTGNMTLFNSTWASDCWQITFPILGFLLVDFSENETNPNRKKRLGWILLIGTILNFILAILLMSYDIKANGGANQEQILQHSVLLPCCFIVYALHTGLKNKKLNHQFLNNFLAELSGATFGIFLIETHTSYSSMIFNHVLMIEPYIGRYMCNIVSILCEFIIYFIVVFLLRRIPCIRKLL